MVMHPSLNPRTCDELFVHLRLILRVHLITAMGVADSKHVTERNRPCDLFRMKAGVVWLYNSYEGESKMGASPVAQDKVTVDHSAATGGGSEHTHGITGHALVALILIVTHIAQRILQNIAQLSHGPHG